jgi:hypothetical protein
MPRRAIERFCIVCRKGLGIGARRKYCDEHLAARVAEIAKQMHEKKGPIWRKSYRNWLKVMRKMVMK